MKNLIVLIGMLTIFSYTEAAHFETNSSKPTEELKIQLRDLYSSKIKGRKIKSIRIEGHTDSRGKTEYNKTLSKTRALSTFEELQKMGVELKDIQKTKVFIVGKGESELLSKGHSDSDHANNRRVVVIVDSDEGKSKTVISECKTKERVIIKEKRVYKKNTVKGFLGYGPVDLKRTSSSRVDLQREPFVGLGYQRHLDEEFSVEAIGTTNGSLMIGGGFSF